LQTYSRSEAASAPQPVFGRILKVPATQAITCTRRRPPATWRGSDPHSPAELSRSFAEEFAADIEDGIDRKCPDTGRVPAFLRSTVSACGGRTLSTRRQLVLKLLPLTAVHVNHPLLPGCVSG
jgi:hypothetical protein